VTISITMLIIPTGLFLYIPLEYTKFYEFIVVSLISLGVVAAGIGFKLMFFYNMDTKAYSNKDSEENYILVIISSLALMIFVAINLAGVVGHKLAENKLKLNKFAGWEIECTPEKLIYKKL